MKLNLSTLPAIVQGASYARAVQGVNADGSIASVANPAPFQPTDVLIATVFLGQELASVFSPTAAWINSSLAQFSLFISNAQSGMLSIDTVYYVEVFATRSGITYPLMAGFLPVLPAAGAQAAALPPDLVSLPYAGQLLGQLGLNVPQLEAIPTLITASSDAFRSWCNRRFDQGMVVETVPVELDGTIRLARPPINYIQRIQCRPQTALTISNTTADTAWIYIATTGDLASGLTITGMTLNWEITGALNSTTITYSGLPTQQISSLATAINAVGSGWTATADQTLGDWAISEIMDGLSSKGASINDQPFGAALFHVYSQNITRNWFLSDNGARTGIVDVGRQRGYSDAARWGPGGWDLFDDGPANAQGQVMVTYNGGYATIPRDIQQACVELVKQQLNRLGTDLILSSEHAADYSYQINTQMLDALPPFVRQTLARYRITNA